MSLSTTTLAERFAGARTLDARRIAAVLRAPAAFSLRVLRGFGQSNGLLLAGAVAYYALLSLVPLLIVAMIVLSHWIAAERLFGTLSEYLEFVVPGQSAAMIAELRAFLEHRQVIGGFLLVTMLFFSSLAFGVLERSMAVIFRHRVVTRRRHFMVTVLMPYVFVVVLTLGWLIVTVVAGRLGNLAGRELAIMGASRPLDGVATVILYLIGVAGEMLLIAAVYLVMPAGRVSWRHALVGGIVAGLLWELTRRALVWYYATMSQIQVVYGSLTTAIAALLSVEIAAIVLLLGAQVIAEFERLPVDDDGKPAH